MRKTYEINNIVVDSDSTEDYAKYKFKTVSKKEKQAIPISIPKVTKIYIEPEAVDSVAEASSNKDK